MPAKKPSLDISILGGGVAGLASAIGLSRLRNDHKITVHEIRPTPATIGGAVNLTPNALRYLDHLGVLDVIRKREFGASVDRIQLFGLYDGQPLGEINFAGKSGNGFGNPPHKALRIMRGELLDALLEAIAKLDNITVKYGQQATSIEETDDSVQITFADNTTARTDMLLGCDGIHSATRRLLIEPDRLPIYSGIAVAFGFSTIKPKSAEQIFFQDTTVVFSRRGSFVASFFNTPRDCVYVGAVMEAPEVTSREGWKAKGADQEKVRQSIVERFSGCAVKDLDLLIENAGDWYLYPAYKLPPRGTWSSKRVMLLGDAAHAMPPQGESTGIALEDTIVFTRAMELYPTKNLSEIFAKYEDLRRSKVDAAYIEASFRWETVKDSGWMAYRMKMFFTPVFLWWTSQSRGKAYEEDLTKIKVDIQ